MLMSANFFSDTNISTGSSMSCPQVGRSTIIVPPVGRSLMLGDGWPSSMVRGTAWMAWRGSCRAAGSYMLLQGEGYIRPPGSGEGGPRCTNRQHR